jgi:diguanylate cyclase (GGDEF)-like protein
MSRPSSDGARRATWYLTALAIAVLGTACALLLAARVVRDDTARARAGLRLTAAEIGATLELTMRREEDLAVTAAAFAAINPRASATAFSRWMQAIGAFARYPELRNLGFTTIVPARALPAGLRRSIVPGGLRPFYCVLQFGVHRGPPLIPPAFDFCAGEGRSLLSFRDSGATFYAGLNLAGPKLAIETPVYRGATTPSTLAGRRREFRGWVGELLLPTITLAQARADHPGVSVVYRYIGHGMTVSFASGRRRHGLAATIRLPGSWQATVDSNTRASSLLQDPESRLLLAGGLLITALTSACVFLLGTGRQRALRLVAERTRALHHQALHDGLTGLPNRRLLVPRIEELLASSRPEGWPTLLFVDLDGFKAVNDTLGHGAGDALLCAIASRLCAAVGAGGTVARFGGDEFVVLGEGWDHHGAGVAAAAEAIIESIGRPVRLEGHPDPVIVTASVGSASGARQHAGELLRDADLALYEAKARGKNRHVDFGDLLAGSVPRACTDPDLSQSATAPA